MPRTASQPHEPLDAASAQPGDPVASIDAWLNVVSRLMHLPETTRSEIRSELREHLRERVRDLLLNGCDERDAVRQAIDELGETAQLARRLEAANRPLPRRLLMHTILALTGAGALFAGVMTFTRDEAPSLPVARFEGGGTLVASPPPSLINTRCTLAADVSLRDALSQVVAAAEVGLKVDWSGIASVGIDPDQPLSLTFRDMPADQALTLLAQAGEDSRLLDWRMRDNNLVEFGVRVTLDRRDVELQTYDISDSLDIIASMFTDSPEAAAEQVRDLLSSLVEPDNWRDNGGDLAQMKLVGGRLFVQAPPRMHEKVKWILEQLPQRDGAGGNQPQVNAGASNEPPILSDIPILSHYFARQDDQAELATAKAELDFADAEFRKVMHLGGGSKAYQAAENRAAAAARRYNQLLQETPSRPPALPAEDGRSR